MLSNSQECPQARISEHTRQNTGRVAHCRIWKVITMADARPGYLITEPGDINRPIAFVSDLSASVSGNENFKSIAMDLLDYPEHLERGEVYNFPITDLRPYGKLDSNRPMPNWVYGLHCIPADESLDQPYTYLRSPRPFCRFLMREMLEHFARETWGEKDREEMPNLTVGIFKDAHIVNDGEWPTGVDHNKNQVICRTDGQPVRILSDDDEDKVYMPMRPVK